MLLDLIAVIAPRIQSTGWMDWAEAHPGTAAWVQTIGALVALLVTTGSVVWSIWDSRRRERMRSAQAKVERLKEVEALHSAADALLFNMVACMRVRLGNWTDPQAYSMMLAGGPETALLPYRRAQQDYEAFPIYLLGDGKLLITAGSVLAHFEIGMDAMRRALAIGAPFDQMAVIAAHLKVTHDQANFRYEQFHERCLEIRAGLEG